MRRFNDTELEVYEKTKSRSGQHIKRLFNPHVQYDEQGNFVVAVVKSRNKIYTGVAKFNPADPMFRPEVGRTIALTRAISKAQ